MFSYNTHDERCLERLTFDQDYFSIIVDQAIVSMNMICSRLNSVPRSISVFASDRINTDKYNYGRMGVKKMLPSFTERTFG